MRKLYTIFICLLFGPIINIHEAGAAKSGEINSELSFEEIFKLKVNRANITGIESAKVPASFTIISGDDIKYGCYRNLNDLLEVYVPGLIWMDDYDGQHLGLRGIIGDRNTKMLLIINGRNMNLKAHNGVTSEIESFNLDDIASVEVIRGPGSATYGPGAAAGIINITTKNGLTSKGLKVNSSYLPEYNSKKASASYGYSSGDLDAYVFAGVSDNNGSSTLRQFRMSDGSGYFIGETGPMNSLLRQDYLADYNNLPQLKFYTEINYTDAWKLWARYTREGGSTGGAMYKAAPQDGLDSTGSPKPGALMNIKQTQTRHLTFAISNNYTINSVTFLESMFSYDIEDYSRRNEYYKYFFLSKNPENRLVKELSDYNNLRHKMHYFSESEILLKSLLNYHEIDDLKLAIGFEFSRNHWGAPMGEATNNFRLGDFYNIISGTDSPIWDGDSLYPENPGISTHSQSYFVGDGWSTNTYSLLFEANYNLSENITSMFSARYDKDDYSSGLFSPRLAFIWSADESTYLKLIACRSNRMNTATQLYQQHVAGNKSDPETLTGLELNLTKRFENDILLDVSLFRNEMQVLSWYDPVKSTRLTGDLKLYGLEISIQYKNEHLNIGLNHSLTKQINWKLADSVNSSGISYSDYYVSLTGSTINDYGNNINNFPVNSTKLFVNYKLFDNKLYLHADARLFWNFEGNLDGIEAVKKAAIGAADEKMMLAEMKALEKENAYKTDLKVNISVNYKIIENIELSVYVLNCIKIGAKRYSYDAAVKFQGSYFMGGFIEEPTAFGASLKIKI